MLIDHVVRTHDSRFPRQWEEQAVAMAMESRWDEAVALNRRILAAAPQDVGALNRLGRALMEVGQYSDSREAYTSSLAVSPSNAIAEKNLARLAVLQQEATPSASPTKVDLKMFVTEPGKAAITTIKLSGKAATMAELAIGELVNLTVNKRALQVRDARGGLFGSVQPRLAHRVIELMNGGNRYEAALVSVGDDGARIVIRETYQDASQLGIISFPAQEVSQVRGDVVDDSVGDDGDEEQLLSDGNEAPEIADDAAAGQEDEAGSDRRDFLFRD